MSQIWDEKLCFLGPGFGFYWGIGWWVLFIWFFLDNKVWEILSLISQTPGMQLFLMRTVEHIAFIIMLVIEIAKIYWTLKAYWVDKGWYNWHKISQIGLDPFTLCSHSNFCSSFFTSILNEWIICVIFSFMSHLPLRLKLPEN